MKRTLTIDYSDEVLLALGCSPEQFSEEVKLLVAVKLYELGGCPRERQLSWLTFLSHCS